MIADRHEINDLEKELFAQTVQQLESRDLISLEISISGWEPEDDPTDPDDDDEDENSVVFISKDGWFQLDDTYIAIATDETIDEATNQQISKGHNVATKNAVAVAGIRLATTTVYTVDWHTERRWEVEFHQYDELYDPTYEQPISLPADHTIAWQTFIASNPPEEAVEARKEQLTLEREESGSVWPLQARLTRGRFWHILPLLQQLGPEHVIDAPVEE